MTADQGIPRTFDDSTRQWITRHVTSVEQLDLLLLLDEDGSRFWSIGNAASALRPQRSVVRAAAEGTPRSRRDHSRARPETDLIGHDEPRRH